MFAILCELWDTPRGSRKERATAILEYFHENFALLGTGEFLGTLQGKSDLFFGNYLNSDNLPLCPTCEGYGDHKSVNTGHGMGSQASPGWGHGGGKGGQSGKGKDGSRSTAAQSTQYCFSMLDQSVTCAFGGSSGCRFLHGPCPSCGGACKSAAVCTQWDAQLIKTKFGDALEARKANAGGKRRRTGN